MADYKYNKKNNNLQIERPMTPATSLSSPKKYHPPFST